MQGTNRVKSVLDKGRLALGVWQMLPGSNMSRTLARAGYDWVLVDCEHGNIDDAAMHEAVPAITSYGVSPIVRVPDFQSWMIKRALDAGAHGVLAPLVRTVEDAKSFVEACRFPPQGKRGFGSPFPMERFGPNVTATQYLTEANANLLLAVQIETKEAFDDVDAIAAVDGLDLLFVGPFDLGNGIGHPVLTGTFAPELEQAIEKVLASAHKAGKKAGIYCGSGTQAKKYADLGYDFVNVITDIGALTSSLASEMQIVTQKAGKTTSGPYGN
ncbi:hypothetical protein PENANT_c014G08606 [Penicillium antarcticum]|uniref:HpcH/HpaI aldolase/citrate lyase domain-containing protein n=1 Tax=Penicillium antarcticum TaxID=416450 RepID=A0A1V6Q4A7_9EURO|nr:uncharacterized protein N7508_009513 [Penicillium antarcticum]KAJ5294692.1 hypothetical protein N7508_009513 [Penicillium antarcticum]OQD84093.1 hypothetical protein PENANT_c014G08606 [Penicillium antarcticum]